MLITIVLKLTVHLICFFSLTFNNFNKLNSGRYSKYMTILIKNKGYTLLELMMTIAIVSILIAVATPSFTRTVISHSVSSDQDTLFTLLSTARSEAIKRGSKVSICKSANFIACDNSASWTDGWIVFFDSDGDGVIDSTDGDTILKINEALDKNISLIFSGGNFISFNSLGRPEANFGTFTFTHSSGDSFYTRTITISTTGRARQH